MKKEVNNMFKFDHINQFGYLNDYTCIFIDGDVYDYVQGALIDDHGLETIINQELVDKNDMYLLFLTEETFH